MPPPPQSPRQSGLHVIIGLGKPDSPKSAPPDFPFKDGPSQGETQEGGGDPNSDVCTCPDPQPVCAACGKPIADTDQDDQAQPQGPVSDPQSPPQGGYGVGD